MSGAVLAYTMVGSTDLARAEAFYAPLFDAMGWERLPGSQFVSWRVPGEADGKFFVCDPVDGRPPAPGNGTMTAFRLASPEEVDRLHAMALENGATDEGAPGPRPQYGATFHAGYLRDPDGNKLAFVHG